MLQNFAYHRREGCPCLCAQLRNMQSNYRLTDNSVGTVMACNNWTCEEQHGKAAEEVQGLGGWVRP